MPTNLELWKRIDIPADLHRELQQGAKIARLSTQGYAAYLISRGLREDSARAEIPWKERQRIPE